jgi:hypothetical protein
MGFAELQMEFDGMLGGMSGRLREPWLEALRAQLGRVLTVMQEFESAASLIRADENLTNIGKSSRLAQLAHEAADRLARLQSEAEGYNSHIQSLQERATPRPPEGNEVVRALRQFEIRQRIDAQEQLTLQANMLSWASDPRHHELCAAVLNSPVPLIDADTEARARELMAQATDPAIARQINELRSAYAAVKSALNSAMQSLRAAGLPADDPIVTMARDGAA